MREITGTGCIFKPSNNHITVEFFDSIHGTWRLTGYYGYPNGERRRAAWEFLRQLSNQYADPWCIFGDFNDIMDDSEKRGRTSRPWWLINGFRQVVLDSGLTDVLFEGYPFTWFKSLGTPRTVEERLDRALANNSNLENLVAPASDHYSILLNRNPVPIPHLRHRNFRYENAWHIEPGFREVVTNAWNMTDHTSIIPKLSASAEDMSSWSKDHCRKLKNNIVECHREMQNIRLNSSENSQSQLLEVRKRMNRPLAQDDAYWRQRAKAYWFRDGDRNTKFFHAAATACKKVNRLLSLEDNAGNKVSNDQGMRDLAKNYFLELFQQHNSAAAPVIDVIQQSVSANDNMSLTAPFTKEEFRDAMFSMHSDKCPGLDGYSLGFYQHFWSLCSDDIYKECCAWLDTGQFPPNLNMKNIAIIPKGNSLHSMKDWRPIALCNVLYKEEERDHLFFQCDYYGRL